MTDKSKPHILFVYPNQFGYHTDSYKYCEHLQETFKISYICFDQGFPKMEMPGINVLYKPYNIRKIKRLIRFYNQIIEFTRNSPTDVLFVVQFKFCFLLGLFVRARIKILDYRTGDLSKNTIIRYVKNRFMWFDALFYNHISSISEGLRDILSLNRSKTLILPLGGDEFSKQVHSYNRLDLLYVGSLDIRNIDQTIEGIALCLERNILPVSSLSYTIIGFGNNNDISKIKRAIDKFNMGKIITFVDRVKYSELPGYFDLCNIGVAYIPKKSYFEHQPATKTFEYINSGLFTIATSTFENSKVICEQNGVLCDDTPASFAQGIELIYNRRDKINDPEIRASLKDFHWEKIVNTILKPYLNNLLTA
jgi:glycosyltransferase involved in cell wall biosynthesis